MKQAILGASMLVLAGCATAPAGSPPVAAPSSAVEALQAYYDTIPDSALPRAPAGASMPADDAVITRILVGSCNDEERESPVLGQIAEESADLFLMIGDNVYGDRDGRLYANNETDLDELRESFADLAKDPDFQAVRAQHAMMATWDDHDYGANDAGREFPFKRFAERIHEVFWGIEAEAGGHDGVYYAKTFGPEGQRTQIIMLDTRYFRSDLKRTDEWNAPGKQRYVPTSGPGQDLLGAEQWAWLEDQLQQPADLRFVVSSIQVTTTDSHGYEHWNNLPAERDRLYGLIEETGATGVVFVSGDRHTGFIYEQDGALPYQAHELTSSSLNLSFNDVSEEADSAQVGAGVAVVNFGDIAIDWDARSVSLKLRGEDGGVLGENNFTFEDIGLN
ncbi:MAG: alkaline phosphatase D family protein [Pseudomonadota bacterium]